MRRFAITLLTVLLAFASPTGALHAMSGGPASDHGDRQIHEAMPDMSAMSCCAGDTQRSVPTCHAAVAVLPAEPGTLRKATRSYAFAFDVLERTGIDPEGLLDPPRL